MLLVKQKQLTVLSLITFFCINLLFSFDLWGRNLNEISKSGVFKIAILNPERDEYDTKQSIRKNNLIKELFSKYSESKLNKKIRLEFKYVNSFSDFWKKNTGKIEINEKYTPDLLQKVDAYFEFMSISDWRKLKADPIPIVKSEYAMICNFKPDGIDINKSFDDKLIRILNNKKIKFISLKDTYLEYLLRRLKISEERIDHITSNNGVVDGMIRSSEKYCTFSETMMILNLFSKGEIYFIGYIPGRDKVLSWWVESNNIEVKNFVNEFIKYLKESDGLNKIFLTLFGVSYDFYNFIVSTD